MPRYRVELSDGRIFHLEADTQPSEEDVLRAVNDSAPSVMTEKVEALDRLLSFLPTVGGAAGGIVGGIGGTVGGMGVGGIPGAVGGAALGGAAGESARQLANRARGRPVPSSSSEAALGIGKEGGMQAIMELAGQAIPRALASGARSVYRGYLKPSLSKAALPKADQIVETALAEALPITTAGSTKANRVIGELRQEVEGILKNAGGSVDLHQVAERVRAFATRRYYKPGRSTADFDAAMEVANRIDAHPSLGLPPGAKPSRIAVSPTKANQVKRGLDESVGEANFGVERGATKTTEKMARRTLRQDLEQIAPDIGGLNARESKLIDAAKAINRAVGRESNKSPLIGVNTMASGALGAGAYASSGDPFTAAAMALGARMALAPAVMSRIALVASRLGKMPGAVPANVARIAAMTVLGTEENGSQP